MISRFPRPAFSRLDVVVVIVLALTLLGFILAFLPRHRDSALRLQCMNNLRRIGEGVHSYHKERDALPPSRIASGYATWAVILAPHVSGAHPLQEWDFRQRFIDQDDKVRLAPQMTYFCPARNRATPNGADGALGDFAAVAGTHTSQHDWSGPEGNGPLLPGEVLKRDGDRIMSWRSRTSFQSLRRGLGYTLLIGEKHVPAGRFGEVEQGDGSLYDSRQAANYARIGGPGHVLAPTSIAPFNHNFGSAHAGVCQFLLADGSVRPLTVATQPDILGRLMTRSDE